MPVAGTHTDMSLVSQVREIRNFRRWMAGLGSLPVGMRSPIINLFISHQQMKDVLQEGHPQP